MVFEIVLKRQIIVPENIINESNKFYSLKEQIGVFNDYWFYFQCKQKDDDIGIYLHIDCPRSVKVVCDFTVNSITRTLDHVHDNNCGWGFSDFGKKTDLFKNGVLTIDSTFKIEFTPKMTEKITNKISHTIALLDDEKFKDFTFCVDGKEIKVHRNIIAVASPAFAAMLEPHTKEFQEGKVDIKDLNYETVNAGVKLMYTRKINENLSIQILLQLYKFADKYDLIDTKEVFEQLNEKINLETVLEISKFSLINSMDELYNRCVNLFTDDFETNAQKIANFKNMDPRFALDIMAKKYGSK